MQTHLANGDLVEAVNHFEQFRALLDHELGLPPSDLFRGLNGPYLAGA